jgi:hydroxymethylglutaryl-CoA lyase
MAGLAEGVDRYESSFGGTGGCPFVPRATGNICTEDLLYLLDEMGIETGIDQRRMIDLACDVQTVLARELPGQVMKAGLRLDLHPMDSVRTATG